MGKPRKKFQSFDPEALDGRGTRHAEVAPAMQAGHYF
jgi:hypothetical protein